MMLERIAHKILKKSANTTGSVVKIQNVLKLVLRLPEYGEPKINVGKKRITA